MELIKIIVALNFEVNFKQHGNIERDLGMLNEEERIYSAMQHKAKFEGHMVSTVGYNSQQGMDGGEIVRSIGQATLENAARDHKAYSPTSREAVSSRQIKASEKGFHLLVLPHVLFPCLDHGMHKANSVLRAKLAGYERLFRVFDSLFLTWLRGEKQGKSLNSSHKRDKSSSMDQLFS